MIVRIAAWLYIINAALTLSSLTFNPFSIGGGMANLAIVMMAALTGSMGVGLLQQRSWARWLALGSSFLGWTLGGLLLILLVGWALTAGGIGQFFGALFAGGVMSIIAFVVLMMVAIWAVSVVISFKLFFYLCSDDGCEAFDVPYGSGGTVAASAAAWIGIFIVNGMMTSGGSLTSLAAASLASGRHSERDSDSERRAREAAQWRAQYEQAERKRAEERRAQREELERARVAEAERYAAEAQAREAPIETAVNEAPPAPAENYLPAASSKSEDDAAASHRILKCRDASGGVTFTQGYCPPGTRQVEMPASE
jgi:hypothetical protein